LAQDFYWFNPAKLPNPIEWVNVRKIRVTDAVTHVWWLSKDINKDSAVDPEGKPKPEANNQRVLQEYSDSQKKLLDTGEYNDGERPSEWNIDPKSFANENDGSIPKNFNSSEEMIEMISKTILENYTDSDDGVITPEELNGFLENFFGNLLRNMNFIEASNTASKTKYLEMCREFDELKSHPARFPRRIPEFFIKFLTPTPDEEEWTRGYMQKPIVLDIFAGSNMTGKVAEDNGRFWLAFEEDEEYLTTSQLRFLDDKEEVKEKIKDPECGLGSFSDED
jgi:site-specific DNA-methyltransferase (cytosine-N4-specific)